MSFKLDTLEAMQLQRKFEALARDQFFGVPVKDFAFAGREQLAYLMDAGLKQDSQVLDIGCGVLRAGYWLIHYLDPGCYCGIVDGADNTQNRSEERRVGKECL